MKLNYEFGFLAKDCPLVSRELIRPWRLAALAVVSPSHPDSVFLYNSCVACYRLVRVNVHDVTAK